jgi:hypothetical protein
MKAIVTILLIVFPFLGRAQNAAAIAKQYWNSVVMIVTQDANRQNLAIGSGLILENGKVVTNFHVIEGAKFAYALSANGSKHAIDGVFATDQANDLAILSVPGLQKSIVVISKDSIQVGQRIYAIGSPEGLSNSISEGIVSGRRKLSGSRLIQITAPISPGSSGGPILDDRGQVIGIAVGTITSGQNLNFAIPISLVFPMLSKTTVNKLSVPVRKVVSGNQSASTNIADGVRVVDMNIRCSDWSSDGLECQLNGFSVNNMLEYSVKNVRIVLIAVNASGVPLDYAETYLCKAEYSQEFDFGLEPCDLRNPYSPEYVEIRPGMSKYFSFSGAVSLMRVMKKSKTDKLIIRVLDFDIMKD